jgi:addiction module HigA family antidote
MPRKEAKLKPIHPGEILRDMFLRPLKLSMNAVALELHVPANRVAEIVNGERGISPETALRLARFFGNSPEFWLNLQTRYDLLCLQDSKGGMIERQVQPRRKTRAQEAHAA